MKVIKINEAQKKRLFEAYREGFSLKELSELGSYGCDAQYDYCVKWLGEPDNRGSSRCVFTLSDSMILKLAVGDKYKAGIAQNKQEYKMYETWDSPLLVRIYNVDKNYTFLVSENVVPAKDIDFEKILGIPFYGTSHQKSLKMPAIVGSELQNYNGKRKSDYTVGYDKYFDGDRKWHETYYYGNRMESLYNVLCYIESNYVLDEGYYDKVYEDIINNSEWLSQFRDFVMYTSISDFCQIENFGIVNRDGNPTLVILDSGLNLNIWDKYYA